jgi:hypothetical protein
MSSTKLKFDYKLKIQMEIDRMKENIAYINGEYNLVQVENTIRDNKRMIVGFLTDNIF